MALTDISAVESLFSEISRFGNLADHSIIEIRSTRILGGGPANSGHLTIFSATNEYSIVFRLPASGDNGYLGCTSQCRTPRAGEDWCRGRDLADGPLTAETWHKILADIVSYEMVRVHRAQEGTVALCEGGG